MKCKVIMGLILSAFVLTIFSQGISAAEKPRHRPPRLLPVDAGFPKKGVTTPEAPAPAYEGMQPDCEDIHPAVGFGRIVQHEQFGSTYYDFQQNSSMGRMIAVGPGGYRHMCFHETRGDYWYYPRYITYNCEDPLNQWLGPTWIDGGSGINPGYANIMVMHDGRALILYHRHSDPPWYSTLAIQDSDYVCSSYFTNLYDLPDRHDHSMSSPASCLWPKGCNVYDSVVDTDYVHIVTTENNPNMWAGQTIGYQRCVFQGTDLVCCSPGKDSCYTTVPG